MDCRCTRRALLQSAGAVLAGSALGCGTSPDLPDASPGDGANNDQFTTCGTNQLCLDLTHPANAALTNINGTVRFHAPNGDTLIVIRVDATTVDTLSDVCTHAGCAVNYTASTMRLLCPCHGSIFSLTGAVVRGPAVRALATYATTFDHAAGLVTITL